jgi:2-amino-4-hydroxy-6-hydroxymethyldihydropteridine diphosphokinase
MSPSKPAASAQTAFLGLGSNLGDRRAHLAQAVARLNRAPGTTVVAVSSIYATTPVGVTEQPEFFNAVAEVRTVHEAEKLLATCQAIERELGRVRTLRWGPRTIDIDLLLFGNRRTAGERLHLPHPRMMKRAFVLIPLAEIAPGRLLEGKPAAIWAAAFDPTGVRRLDARFGNVLI